MDYKLVLVFLGLVSCCLAGPNPKSYKDAVQSPVDTIIKRIEEPGFFSPSTGKYEKIVQQQEDNKYKELKEEPGVSSPLTGNAFQSPVDTIIKRIEEPGFFSPLIVHDPVDTIINKIEEPGFFNPLIVHDPVDTIINKIEEPGFFSPLIGEYEQIVQQQEDDKDEELEEESGFSSPSTEEYEELEGESGFSSPSTEEYEQIVQQQEDNEYEELKEEPEFLGHLIGEDEQIVQQQEDDKDEELEEESGFSSPSTEEYEQIVQQQEDDKYKELKETVKEFQKRNSKILDLMQEISQSCSETEARKDVAKLLEKINQFEIQAKLNVNSISDFNAELKTRLSSEPDNNLLFATSLLDASASDLISIYKLIHQDHINIRTLYNDNSDLNKIKKNINELKTLIDREVKFINETPSFISLTEDSANKLN